MAEKIIDLKTGKARKKRGRPTSLTKNRADAVIDAILKGATRAAAAAAAGVHKATFFGWMARGDEEHERKRVEGGAFRPTERKFVDFYDRVKAADAEVLMRRVKIVEQAAESSWQAAAWLLERTDPANFARTTKVSGGDQPINVNTAKSVDSLRGLGEDDLLARYREALSRIGSGGG